MDENIISLIKQSLRPIENKIDTFLNIDNSYLEEKKNLLNEIYEYMINTDDPMVKTVIGIFNIMNEGSKYCEFRTNVDFGRKFQSEIKKTYIFLIYLLVIRDVRQIGRLCFNGEVWIKFVNNRIEITPIRPRIEREKKAPVTTSYSFTSIKNENDWSRFLDDDDEN